MNDTAGSVPLDSKEELVADMEEALPTIQGSAMPAAHRAVVDWLMRAVIRAWSHRARRLSRDRLSVKETRSAASGLLVCVLLFVSSIPTFFYVVFHLVPTYFSKR